MTASLSPEKQSPQQNKSEFVIYSFEKDEISKGSPVWQALKTLDDEAEACRIADILFKNDKFTRIEVRKKGDNDAVKICDRRPSMTRKLYLMGAAACFCVVTAGIIAAYQI
ncbi:MAG: hypothetical protein DI586_04090 [Micavibrio aeruginosavorus]|uniref:Uncharacterized protein n=1 Tax=Micavibrio aeruginosavorus TaxID=349221 RepID=A0A2W5HRL0_9BACT|nr:MAG: hypothetical protein DI586_04090 [Micavibrio aeruginosavorus]